MTKIDEHELIIVRRRPDHDSYEPKTGVWKIAHADFMTAMMAFFLVMWLISTTDDAAKREIAQYFNPVKLAEMSQYQKGVADPEAKSGSADSEASSQVVKDGTAYSTENISSEIQKFGEAGNRTYFEGATTSEVLPTYTEAEIFSDPYGVLNRIMMSADPSLARAVQQASERAMEEASIGNKGGTALRDPFDPLYWQLQPDEAADSQSTADVKPARVDPLLGEAEDKFSGLITGPDPVSRVSMGPALGDRLASVTEGLEASPSLSDGADKLLEENLLEENLPHDETAKAGGNLPMLGEKTADPVEQKSGEQASDMKLASAEKAEAGDAATGEEKPSQRLARYRAALEEEMNRAPKLDVTNELSVQDKGDGLLIDVTDSPTWGMFAVGSSEPSAQSIALLEKIARSLSSIDGKIIIRGHTDGRPFRGKDYDNWRLSTARAHMARFMLIRGGLDEKRLLRVEGYADQQLKHPDHPEADDNRRIEILVQPTAGAN
ncbi:MotB family protein [uncultured Cohaesibacter sp.]|uniref:MotB family protein n=1 Tax=uncultured Cohaesibacter sp. TaxID=1002546 RepID=UPI0029C84057|nr:MotB family protein [uncultured Cohaesibacter sp.]